MNYISEGSKGQVPVLFISNDGQVTIEGLYNDEQSLMNLLSCDGDSNEAPPVKQISEEVTEDFLKPESSSSLAKETLVNIDVNSEVLEGYMEVFVTYRCKECAYESNDQKEFHQHCLEHLLKEQTALQLNQLNDNTTYIYLCSSCSKAFNSPEETKQHMIEEHELTSETYSCEEIPDGTKTINLSIETSNDGKVPKEYKRKRRKPSDIIQSIDPTSNVKLNYACPKRTCNCKFSNEKDLNIHLKCHLHLDNDSANCKLFRCFECTELFNDWHGCSTHLYKVHEIDCDLLKCPICETYRTSTPLRLENHIRIHSDVRAFTCKHCGKTFKQASQLRNHSVIHSEVENVNKPKWSRSKQCNICFKMYSDSKSLKKHKEEVHSRLRPFVCNICGHASARKSMLVMHQRQHTGQKPYECSLCGYKTGDHNSLRRHIMRHTGVRPYKCPHCEYTAIQSGSYKNHMKIVHPNMEGVYVCNVCFYKTISEDNHVRHISDHLTGLIKDNRMNDDTNLQMKVSDNDITAPSDFITTSLFRSGVNLEEEELEVSQEYSNENSSQVMDDDVIDTGGITIPAEPHPTIMSEEKECVL